LNLHLTRPNLGQPIITTTSELASGVSFIISSEPNAKASDIASSLKDNLAIRPIDQKEVKFPLRLTNVQTAKVNHQQDIAFKYIGTHLIVHNVFETKKETLFWEVTVCSTYGGDILNGKKKRLFDVLVNGSNIENNHALCVYESIENGLSFIHSSDLHMAKRNDETLDQIKTKAPQSEYEDARKNFINFNENFRTLIRYVNSHSDEIDFLIVSGDLVDYYQPDELYNPDQPFEGEACSFEKSNLSIFYDAVLGRGPLNQNNELTVPVFTTTGNHDFRPYHYNLSDRGQFNKFGLKQEYIHYIDEVPVRPLDSITPANVKWLKEYFKRVNPDLDYFVRFGNTDLIFLDGGKDNYSFFHLWDALGGSPDTECVTDVQVELINSYLESKRDQNPILIIMHTPPINIRGGYKKDELYEDYRQQKTGNRWIDYKDDDLSYGTLAYNWGNFLEVLTGLTNKRKYKVDLVLSGHTHQDIEFRLEYYYDRKDRGKEVGIYCWNYSDQLVSKTTPEERKEWWEENKPFVLQTAATGPIGNDRPGVRRIVIENNQLKEMTGIRMVELAG
jgi:3',5'-cyclic AMP phosphodiesterase CpdA